MYYQIITKLLPRPSISLLDPHFYHWTFYLINCPLNIYIYIFHHKTCESTGDTMSSSAADRGDNRFGSSTHHSWRYQAAFATGQGIKRIIYIYIYTPDQLREETTLDVNLHFQCAVCDLKKKKKNAITFGGWCYDAFTVTVSYVITWEGWFRVYFLYAENFSLSTKSNLMHITPRSEDDLRQLSNWSQWFLFLKETKWLSVL